MLSSSFSQAEQTIPRWFKKRCTYFYTKEVLRWNDSMEIKELQAQVRISALFRGGLAILRGTSSVMRCQKIKLNIFYVLLFSFWLKSFALKYDLMMLESKSKPDLFNWRKIRRRLIYLKAQLTLNFIFQRYRRIVKGSFLSKPVVLRTITGSALDLVFLFLVTCHASDCAVCPKILLSSG